VINSGCYLQGIENNATAITTAIMHYIPCTAKFSKLARSYLGFLGFSSSGAGILSTNFYIKIYQNNT